MPGSCSSRLRKSAQDDKWSFCLTASYDLQDYSIVNLAFPQRSQTGPGAVPDNINLQGQEDNIYVQGQEDGVVYSLVSGEDQSHAVRDRAQAKWRPSPQNERSEPLSFTVDERRRIYA